MFLNDRFPGIWEAFQSAQPLPECSSSQFLIPLPNGQVIDLLVDEAVFSESRRQRLSAAAGAAGAVVWGVASPEELLGHVERFAGRPFLYVESDRAMFERILTTVPLSGHFSSPRSRIAFVGDCGRLMADVALVFGEETHERILTRVWVDVAPSLLIRMLDDRHPLGSFVSLVLENVYLNQSEAEKERRKRLYDQGVRGLKDLFPADYLYQAMVHWLTVYLVASPGIRSLYRGSPPQTDPAEVLPASIVILAWNRWDLTEKCIRSILHHPILEGTEIVVVDNGSTDITPFALNRMAEKIPFLRTLRLPSNAGPAGGREAALKETRGRTLIFFDNDVTVKHPRWMEILLEPLIQHPRAGASGAFGVIHTSDETETWTQKILFPGLAVPVNWISSFCLAVKRQALTDCGGWRPDLYHLYGMEDVALGYALRESGWASVVPGQFVPVTHGMNHKDGHYDYDFNATGQKNTEAFKRLWGDRHRVLNLARNNQTLAAVPASADRSVVAQA